MIPTRSPFKLQACDCRYERHWSRKKAYRKLLPPWAPVKYPDCVSQIQTIDLALPWNHGCVTIECIPV